MWMPQNKEQDRRRASASTGFTRSSRRHSMRKFFLCCLTAICLCFAMTGTALAHRSHHGYTHYASSSQSSSVARCTVRGCTRNGLFESENQVSRPFILTATMICQAVALSGSVNALDRTLLANIRGYEYRLGAGQRNQTRYRLNTLHFRSTKYVYRTTRSLTRFTSNAVIRAD